MYAQNGIEAHRYRFGYVKLTQRKFDTFSPVQPHGCIKLPPQEAELLKTGEGRSPKQ